MRPDWLSVPAAPREARPVHGRTGDAGGQRGQSQPRVVGPKTAMKTRILIVSVDSCRDACRDVCWEACLGACPDAWGDQGFNDGFDIGAGELTAAEPRPQYLLLHGHQVEWDADPDRRVSVDIERVRLRGPVPSRSRAITPALDDAFNFAVNPQRLRWYTADRGSCCGRTRMDKHPLDLALSAGRHAAERAKLAGIGHLLGWAPRLDARASSASPDPGRRVLSDDLCVDPYEHLRCAGHPEMAALVGLAIAGAQMGLSVHLPDPVGQVAARTALRLNPGIVAWLDFSRAEQPARTGGLIRILATADP